MARHSFKDIIPPGKRSIRDISLPKRESMSEDVIAPTQKKEEDNTVNIREFGPRFDEAPKKGRVGIWLIAVICIVVLVFSISFLISKAEIRITVKSFDISIDNDFTATKDTSNKQMIQYSTIELTKESSVSIESDITKNVETYAEGTVVIYNNQTVTQKLVAGTRLADSSGKIFKTAETVTIGARTSNGSNIVPGSVDMKVKAEKPGTSYNVGLVDLSIVAFKGSPKYEAVYARAKTPLQGGQTGKLAVLTDKALADAKNSLGDQIKQKVLEEARAQVPAEYFLPETAGTVDISFENEIATESDVTIKGKASFKGYIFNKEQFVDEISDTVKTPIPLNGLIKIDSTDLQIANISENKNILKMSLNGGVIISYDIDTISLKKDLMGKSKKEALKILETYPSISKARITTSPFWKVPSNSNKITVILE